MKGTPFTVLYESVLSKIKDYDFLNLEETDIYEVLSKCREFSICSFRIVLPPAFILRRKF